MIKFVTIFCALFLIIGFILMIGDLSVDVGYVFMLIGLGLALFDYVLIVLK